MIPKLVATNAEWILYEIMLGVVYPEIGNSHYIAFMYILFNLVFYFYYMQVCSIFIV